MNAAALAVSAQLRDSLKEPKVSTAALKLYEHVTDYQTVLDWIEEHGDVIEANGGELPPELLELLDEAEGSLKEKIGRVGLVILNLQASQKAAKSESDRLRGHANAFDRQVTSLKEYLRVQLARLGEDRVDTPLCKVRIQKNPPTIRPADPSNIPEQYRITPPPPPPVFDRDRAMHDLKALDLIPHEPTDVPIEIDGIVIEVGQHCRVW